MLAEPDLDHRALAAALDEYHGLAPRTLRFVPAGETAWCYRLTDDRGGRWFVKLARPGAIDPARAEFALELAGALAGLGLPVPRPRPTRSGRRWCRLDGLRMAVFELVDADPLDDRALAEPATAKRVARLIAAIHAATPALTLPVPFAGAGLAPARGAAHHAGARAGLGADAGTWPAPPQPRRPGRLAGGGARGGPARPQRHADLDGVRWCPSRWPELEARMDHTRRLLAQRRRIS